MKKTILHIMPNTDIAGLSRQIVELLETENEAELTSVYTRNSFLIMKESINMARECLKNKQLKCEQRIVNVTKGNMGIKMLKAKVQIML